jgi:hypothetical protein
MSISAITASAREDGRLRPYVFNALWKSGNRFSDKDMRKITKSRVCKRLARAAIAV